MRFCTLLGCNNAIWSWTGRPVHDVALHMLVLSVVVASMARCSTNTSSNGKDNVDDKYFRHVDYKINPATLWRPFAVAVVDQPEITIRGMSGCLPLGLSHLVATGYPGLHTREVLGILA
ncbi:hypothetical protein V2G26_007231 [Clonostachys chloroleuca]